MSEQKSKAELKNEFKRVLTESNIFEMIKQYEAQRKDELPVWILEYLAFALIIFGFAGIFMWGIKCLFISWFGAGILILILKIFKPEYITTRIRIGDNVIVKEATKEVHSDIEMLLKDSLMPKLLAVFGNFKWAKLISSESIFKKLKTLMIFPNCPILYFDDCLWGSRDKLNFEIMEVKYNLLLKTLVLLRFIFIAAVLTGMSLSFLIAPFILLISWRPAIFITMILGIFAVFVAFCFFIYKCFKILSSENFNGVVIEYHLPKKFKGWTFLYENKISAANMNLKDKRGFEKITLEDVEFNKKYTVYSTDQVEARYVLTAGFIERFNNIKTAFKAEFIRAEFRNGELFVIMKVNDDLFKMGSIMEETTYITFLKFFEEIYSVLDLSDQLKVNQDIGM